MKLIMLITAAPAEAISSEPLQCFHPYPGYGWFVGSQAHSQAADTLEECCNLCCGNTDKAWELWTFSEVYHESPAGCRCDFKQPGGTQQIPGPGSRDTLGSCANSGPPTTSSGPPPTPPTPPLPPITPSLNPDSLLLISCSDKDCSLNCQFLDADFTQDVGRLLECHSAQCSRFDKCTWQNRWVNDSSEAYGGYVMTDYWHNGYDFGCPGAPGSKDGPTESVFNDILSCHEAGVGPYYGFGSEYYVQVKSYSASVV